MSEFENRKDITVPMDESEVEQVHDQLGYGDSRAEWIRNAVREKLAREEAEAETDGGETPSAA